MLKCIAIDDEELALELLEDNIHKVHFLELKAKFTSPLHAIEFLQKNDIDLIFIDIQMPGITGLQFIKSFPQKCMYILITAYEKYALQGYDLNVVDYLLKPVAIDSRISFAGMLGGAARRVWSDVAHLRARQTLRDLATLFLHSGLRDVLPLIGKPEQFGRRVFRVVIKPFMDAHTYDHKRIQQCCTKILNAQGEAVSFCEYNVFHRGRKSPEMIIPLSMKR